VEKQIRVLAATMSVTSTYRVPGAGCHIPVPADPWLRS
jgi:hypothetical protein